MTSEQKPGTKDKVAGRIANGILWAQQKFSDRMNRFKDLKTFLICFCIVSASISTWVFVDAFVTKPKSKIRIDRIQSPRPIQEKSEELYDEKIPDDIYQQMQAYKRYMDSIGEPIRPGLADSMRYLEEMYLQQLK